MGRKEAISRREFLKLGLGTAGALAAVLFGRPPKAVHAEKEADKEEEPPKLLEKLLIPFINKAEELRRQRKEKNPKEYENRIDEELNSGRVNFLLFGYGETFEPPNTIEAGVRIGSYSIVSYNTRTKKIDVFSITHDTRAPEIERYQKEKRKEENPGPIKIDRAFWLARNKEERFELMRQIMENATGFNVDYIMNFSDGAIVNYVDSVVDGIEVNVPKTIKVNRFRYDGQLYERETFEEGRQRMGGLRAVQYMKTVPDESKERYDKDNEHNIRKLTIIKAMLKALSAHKTDLFFWKRLYDFIEQSTKTKDENRAIAYDFDVGSLLLPNLIPLGIELAKTPFDGTDTDLDNIDVGNSGYAVDQESGDGSLCWVDSDGNPISKKDVERGIYKDKAIEVPIGGDPYAENLVTGYWRPVRELVKERFLGRKPLSYRVLSGRPM